MVCRPWGENQATTESHLQQTLTKCLSEINNNGFNSVAIPALFTKTFRYSVDAVTRCIVNTLNDYFSHNPDSSINTVLFCDSDDARVASFLRAMKATKWGVPVVLDCSAPRLFQSHYIVAAPGIHFILACEA